MLPIPFKCDSPACRSDLTNFRRTFYVDSGESPCPNCNLAGYLSPCATIHLLVQDRYGPITSSSTPRKYGEIARFNFLCDVARKGYLLPFNHPLYPRHYTDMPSACTCTACLLEYGGHQINGEILILR